MNMLCQILSLSVAAAAGLLVQPASGEEISDTINIGGWIRGDYGAGDRYPESQGEDTLGVSQAALLGKWSRDNVEAILLIGGTNLTADDSDGDIGIKDAFIVWKEIGGSKLSLSVGAQPLFFGLKPNGFPGDRSLQPSIEFGGAGGFAVAQQAGPSVIFEVEAHRNFSIRGGLFDTSSSTAEYFRDTGLGRIDGSSIEKNYFVQAEVGLGDRETGFYAVAGFEGRYVGGAIDSTEPIVDVGAGYRSRYFDLSVEYILLDEAIVGTADEEAYAIAELTVEPADRLSLHFDYAMADEADLQTLRAGLTYEILKDFRFRVEYSDDDFGERREAVNSFDVRLEISF